MNKLFCSALAATTVVGATGFAGESEDWASLDRELETLSATLSTQAGGPQISGWVITAFDWNSDADEGFDLDGDGTDDETKEIQGFDLRSVRLNVKGNVGDYGYKVSFDLADGDANLEDAYATWNIGDQVSGRLGRFKPPTLSSFLISRNRLLFLERTAIGSTFMRDTGLQFSGDFETVGWWIAVHNGIDGNLEDHLITGRVAVDLLGEGVGAVEGAYGAPDGTALTVAGFFQDEGSLQDGSRFGAEARLTSGPFAAAAEMFDNDTDQGDNTPWDVTLSYLFTEEYEAAVRWEDADDDADTTAIAVGVNRYVMGHDIKWTLQWRTVDSDFDAAEQDTISVGLALSF